MAAYPTIPSNALQQSKLLLCDDSPVERMALGHFLRNAGYNVAEASDGQSALEFLKLRAVDLLLLDLHMPGVDGFDVLTYLQKHRPDLPVIIMSGLPLNEIQEEMSHLPRAELPPFFIKPVDPEQVLDLVEMQLNGELEDQG